MKFHQFEIKFIASVLGGRKAVVVAAVVVLNKYYALLIIILLCKCSIDGLILIICIRQSFSKEFSFQNYFIV